MERDLAMQVQLQLVDIGKSYLIAYVEALEILRVRWYYGYVNRIVYWRQEGFALYYSAET